MSGQRRAAVPGAGDEPADVGASGGAGQYCDLLRQRGAQLLGPDAGDQACGDIGAGRMLEPPALRDALAASFAAGVLHGLRVLVSRRAHL